MRGLLDINYVNKYTKKADMRRRKKIKGKYITQKKFKKFAN